MLFLTRWFGVTGSDQERDLSAEKARIEEIVEKVLLMQAQAAAKDVRPLGRGTHAKGVTVRGQFEVFDASQAGRDRALAPRLAKGIFARPGVYPATVRFANSDSRVNSDFKPDVRSMSVAVDLGAHAGRQDFSLQNAPILPINDSTAFLAIMKVLTAPSPGAGLWSLSFRDKLRVLRTLALVAKQTHQKIKPYQQLRYWSNVPFRHGPADVVKQSAIPFSNNSAQPLHRHDPKGLQNELIRHLNEDSKMSSFDIGLQFLDAGQMTYWGQKRDPTFWIENASVEWKESQAPFHTVGRLTLMAKSQLSQEASDATYFDVTGKATPDSKPLGSINRARWSGEVASREARMRAYAVTSKAY
jgi:catalase